MLTLLCCFANQLMKGVVAVIFELKKIITIIGVKSTNLVKLYTLAEVIGMSVHRQDCAAADLQATIFI